MKNFYFLLLQLACTFSFLSGNICYASNENEVSTNVGQNKVLSIRKELENISTELSNLENIFIYKNKDTLAQGVSLDILLRMNQLENRLASAIGFLENLENKFEKTTSILILRMAEIDQTLAELDGEKSLSRKLIELHDEVTESSGAEEQKFRQLPEDQREYLSIKAIFDDGNYELAVEEFGGFWIGSLGANYH